MRLANERAAWVLRAGGPPTRLLLADVPVARRFEELAGALREQIQRSIRVEYE